ncbi:hemicentin-2-like [Mya arenaria]|uniref:hemicentin-2-like n=1 Tax=Mya arenaria TaxID=6604 RepID=UPI0022E26754|nr:hemicentin-2-like [Mya arenaria]
MNSNLQTYRFILVKISFNMELLIYAWSVFYCINAVISSAFITYVNLNPKNDPVSVIENTIYQFECEISIGSPYATVRWFKDNKTIDDIADDIELTQLSTSSQLNEVTRSVLQLQPTKDDHGMRLFCLANNGGSDIYSSKPILDVLYGPSIPKCQFNSSVVNENISIRKGQDLTISCSADGNPPPFLMWTYPGGTYSGPTLSLRKIAIDGSRNFTCSSRNTLKPTDGQEVTGSTSFTFAVNVYARPSESGMSIYCVAQNVINKVTSTNSLLLAIIGIPDTPYNVQVKDVKTDAATLKWNQLYTGGLELSVAIELRENTNEWKEHEVSEIIINDTDMRAALNNLNASTSYVLRFMVFNVLGRSMISDEMQFQTLN